MLLVLAFLTFHLNAPAPDVPLRQPQLASSGDLVALAYGQGKSIYVATSKNGGKSFADPVKVGDADILPLGRHRGPRIAISNGVVVVTAVAGKHASTGPHAHGLPADGDLLMWRSPDEGKTWSAAKVINDVPGAAREGLHTLAADGGGRVFAAWLDLRGKGTKLYGAYSTDSGSTWSRNQILYESPEGTICQCCHPSAAFSPTGHLWVMWRNCLGGARDMYAIRSTDGQHFEAAQKLGEGTWALNACPMDGGGIAVSTVHVFTAWRRGTDLFLAEPGNPEQRIGTGRDVALALSAGRPYAVWSTGPGLEWWSEGGEPRPLADAGTYPALVAVPGGAVLAAWEQANGISMQTLQ